MSTRHPFPVRTIAWDYAYLIEVRAQGDSATLTCGTEADTPEFEVVCDTLDLLAPFAEIHAAWRLNPAAVEPPLIPFTRTGLGQHIFSPEGARHDYPYATST